MNINTAVFICFLVAVILFAFAFGAVVLEATNAKVYPGCISLGLAFFALGHLFRTPPAP